MDLIPRFVVQAAMDGAAIYKEADKMVTFFKKTPHEHYSSVIGPYCVACHISLKGPDYKLWADGQVAI